MSTARLAVCLAATAALCSSLSGAARAQNLLANPDFDADLAGWPIDSQFEFLLSDWSASDVDGSLASGSFEFEVFSSGWAAQCVSVTPGASYALEGFVARRSTGGEGRFAIDLGWYGTGNCSIPSELDLEERLLAPDTPDVWHELEGVFVAPASAQGVEVRLVSLGVDSGTPIGLFDSIFLPEPGPLAATGAAVLALAALGRSRGAGRRGAPQ